MIKVGFVRGAYLNNFEGQNFLFDKNINFQAFASMHPIHTHFPFPVSYLRSVADLYAVPLLNQISLWGQGVKYLSNRIIGDSQLLFGLEKALEGYEVIDTADPHYYYSYQLARMRSKNQIKKLIVTYCEVIPHNNESVTKKKYIKYFTMHHADLFVCHTQRSKNALITEGVPEHKVQIVRLGVDLQRFTRVEKKPSEKITILFVGRLVPEKGIFDLYKAFSAISKLEDVNIYLKIIGSGPLKNDIETQVRRDALEKKVQISEIPYEQMHSVYQESDIFVLPARSTKTIAEQYGMVLLEAMACGLPVIGSDVGAIPEVIGEAGHIVPQSNIDALKNILLSLIKQPDLRKSQGEKAYQRSQKEFDSRKTSEILGKIYIELAKSS